MIVTPEFVDHWKTVLLASRAGSQAVFGLLRIWGHCQTSKNCHLPASADVIASIARYRGKAETFLSALIESKYIEAVEDGESRTYYVHEWDEYNASLIASWRNGNKGGRRRKKPTGFPQDTDGKPTGDQPKTQRGTDKRRVEKRRTLPVVPLVNKGDTHTDQTQGFEGDEAHGILMGNPNLRELTYEMDLAARKFWPMSKDQLLLCAKNAAALAELLPGPPDQVGYWWKKRLELWMDGLKDGARKGLTSGNRSVSRKALMKPSERDEKTGVKA